MIQKANSSLYSAIVELWERSVRATHHFLPEDYLQHIKTLLPSILPQVAALYVEQDETGYVYGFLGVVNEKIEMLFLDPDSRGKGIGRSLTQFAIDRLGARKVDVNEQNAQAVGFYQKIGFAIKGRSDTDGLGKPYPLLHMEWVGTQEV